MSWSEREIRSVFLSSLGRAASEACPSAEAIWDTLQMRVTSADRYRLISHMSECAHCAQVWQAAKLIREESGERLAPQNTHTKTHSGSGWRMWLRPSVLMPALGGVFALAVALVGMGPQGLSPLAPPTASDVIRGGSIGPRLVTLHESTRRLGDTLQWRRDGGTSRHQVVLFDAASDTRLELSATDPEQLTLSQDVARAFPNRASIQWYVVAVDGDSPGAQSGVRSFVFVND